VQQFPDRLPWMVSGHVRQTRPAGIREILKPDSTGRLVRLLNLVLSKVLNLVSIDLAGFSESLSTPLRIRPMRHAWYSQLFRKTQKRSLPETKFPNIRTEAHGSGFIDLKFGCYIIYIGNPDT
jgi:hypothetical protein